VKLDERKLRILQAIIDDYIVTAIPVASRTISKKYDMGVSPATIRNEMSDLEELGYLDQPHVSAGRVPSNKAYRLYVDELVGSFHLDEATQSRLRDRFMVRARQIEDVVGTAAQALSELTNYTSVVMTPKQQQMRIRNLQLVQTSSSSALVVIVTDSGIVRDCVIRVHESLDSDALYAISKMLTERLSGHTLGEVEGILQELIKRAPGNENVARGISTLMDQLQGGDLPRTVKVAGTSNIFNYPEYNDVTKAKALISLLEDKERLSELMRSRGAMEFSIRIGAENGLPEMNDCTMATATYRVGQGTVGTIGIIGPTRMNYKQALSTMLFIGRQLSDMLSQSNVPLPDGSEDTV
jgi:heat-inducible transcriptional repressor